MDIQKNTNSLKQADIGTLYRVLVSAILVSALTLLLPSQLLYAEQAEKNTPLELDILYLLLIADDKTLQKIAEHEAKQISVASSKSDTVNSEANTETSRETIRF